VRVGIPSLRESGGSTLRGKLGARGFLVVCVCAPLRLGGLRGKKSTPSVGWEVPVKLRLASGRTEGSLVAENNLWAQLHQLWYSC
jgi:hypothetical protein